MNSAVQPGRQRHFLTETTLGGLTGKALRLLVWVYVGVSLVDPLDQIFHSKSALFLSILAVWFFRAGLQLTKPGTRAMWAGLTGYGLLIPFLATTVGLLRGRYPAEGVRFSTIEMFLMLFLIVVITSEEIDLVSVIARECILVALITIGITIAALVSPVLYGGIYEFTAAKQTAYLSLSTDRILGGVGSFYYKTSATMILPLAYSLHRVYTQRGGRATHLILTLLYTSALVFSGARANVLGAGAILALFTIWKIRQRAGWWTALPVALVIFGITSVLYLPKALNPTEASNSVKLEHWNSYLAEFEAHPSYLLIGEGADTEFYSSGFEEKTTITELTYMELLRNFGIPVAMLLIAGLLWPLVWLAGGRARAAGISYLGVPYGVYLLMSASNPLLLNTTGMLVVISIWGAVLMVRQRASAGQPLSRQFA